MYAFARQGINKKEQRNFHANALFLTVLPDGFFQTRSTGSGRPSRSVVVKLLVIKFL